MRPWNYNTNYYSTSYYSSMIHVFCCKIFHCATWSCIYQVDYRSSQRRYSIIKVVLRNFAKFISTCVGVFILNKVAALRLANSETLAQVFSCEFSCKIVKKQNLVCNFKAHCSIKVSSVNVTKSSDEILCGKFHFLCSGNEATTHNNIIELINPFIHFVEKWPNIL